MEFIIKTPEPPYIAVIFTSIRKSDEGYTDMSELLDNLSKEQEGFLGMESVRNEAGEGVAVSYWTDEKYIREWKHKTLHQQAQKLGKERWYDKYKVRICKVQRDYAFNAL